MFEILYFIMSSSAELKQKYHFTALFLAHITYCPLDRGTMDVSYHKEHVVPPRTQDGFILESKNERDKFGPHVSRIKLLFFLYKSSRSFPFHGKTCIMRIRRI